MEESEKSVCEWIINNLDWLCPLFITILFSVLNTIVAKSNLKLAKQQKAMQNDGFCFQLYDKRLFAYESADRVLCDVLREGKVEMKNLNEFLVGTRNVKFLFGNDMIEECDAIYKVLNKLRVVGVQINHNKENQISNQNHVDLCNNEYEMFISLSNHQNKLSEIASKYISFSNYKIQSK